MAVILGNEAFNHRGLFLLERGRFTEAVHLFDKAIIMAIDDTDSYTNRGIALKASGRRSQAISSFVTATRLDPTAAELMVNVAAALFEIGRIHDAEKIFSRALSTSPASARALDGLGISVLQTHDAEDALTHLRRAVVVEADNAEIQGNVSGVLNEVRRHEESLQHSGRSLAVAPAFIGAMNNRALSYLKLDGAYKGLSWAERAFSVDPRRTDTANTRAVLLAESRRYEEALAAYELVRRMNPEAAEPCWNMGLIQLLQGNYREGWLNYHSRWRVKQSSAFGPWLGEQKFLGQVGMFVENTVFVYHEQGYGDTLQFCRYVRLASARGAKVIMQVPGALVRLFRGQAGMGEVIETNDPVPSFDLHSPMMSLPLAFGTTLETIPYGKEAYLAALPDDVSYWAQRLALEFGARQLRVGVVWNGGFRPGQPELWAVNERRNVPLELFAQALDLPGIHFVSLQKGDPAESQFLGRERDYWRLGRVFNAAAELHDFADTAGLIANLDLVISVDTSTAHLAAALGKPTWILNRYDTCWRWLLDRQDSPWYGSVRLYRQGAHRDWRPVLAIIAKNLGQTLSDFQLSQAHQLPGTLHSG